MPTSNAMPGNSASATAAQQIRVDEEEALQRRGLDLAYFIVADRGMAFEILSKAMNKLAAQRSRETKRAYWRDKYLKRRITRIVREECDALQWLIYFEAERYEREQERTGRHTRHDMVVRYIKYLVQATTAMSSLYVHVGLNRLLRNYTTPEVRQVYEWVTEHYPSDQEYRKVKAILMEKLKSRFESFLKTCSGPYGELRFQSAEDQTSWVRFVDECLRTFTPWSTAEACESLATAGGNVAPVSPGLQEKIRGSMEDRIEMSRSHRFIDPTCYGRITEALSLEPPDHRLALPRFFMNGETGGANSRSPRIPDGLTQEERKKLGDRLSIEAERRSRVAPGFLKILVDGREYVWLDSGQSGKNRCQLEEGAKLVEVWTHYEGADVLLGTHWIAYTQSAGIAAAAATLDLGNRRELLLEIIPAARTAQDAGGAMLWLKCCPTSALARATEFVTDRSFWLYGFPKYAFLALLFLAAGWNIARLRSSHELSAQHDSIERLTREVAEEKRERASLEKRLESERQAPIETYSLAPDETATRSGQETPEPAVTFAPQVPQVILEIPVAGRPRTEYRVILKPFLESRAILVENFPKPAHPTGTEPLKFVLPASFLESGKHYVLELNAISPSGHSERIHTFTFLVAKR
ncbi:MAG TPA: hypothetical protein VI685_07060 [Candidatus Angelobacter sp.]